MVNRTPTIDQYGSDFRLNTIDIRTQAISMPKVFGTISVTDVAYAALGGHTLDSGVLLKSHSHPSSNDILFKVDGATLSVKGFSLSPGQELFIPSNQLSKILYATDRGSGPDPTLTYEAS